MTSPSVSMTAPTTRHAAQPSLFDFSRQRTAFAMPVTPSIRSEDYNTSGESRGSHVKEEQMLVQTQLSLSSFGRLVRKENEGVTS